MTPATLKRLVARGEGPTLEFKRTTGELREGMEALCSMLNAAGRGTVLFGVSDKGEILGQDCTGGTLRDIANATRRIEPAAEITTSTVRVKGSRSVVVVEGVSKVAGPYSFEGRGYLRVGNTTQRMSHSEFDRRVVDRLKSEFPWDRWIAPNWKVRDLDRTEIQRAVEDAVEAKRLTGVLGEKIEVVLRRLELVTDQGVTRAAAILFGREDGPGFPMGEIRLARFRGITKDEFRDNRQFKGHAFALLQHAERFLDEHVPIASRFVEGRMRRVDEPLYPPLAFREALVNALIHRDYSIDGGAVSVAIFDDRLEVWSTGTLLPGLTLKKLKGTHESIPRNRLIAEVFHRRGLIERWGRGTNKILAEAKKAGCPEPEFKEIAGAFVVRFRPVVPEKKTSMPIGFEVRGKQILEILRKFGPLNVATLRLKLPEAVTARTLQRELKQLLKSGHVVATGRARATIYRATADSRR